MLTETELFELSSAERCAEQISERLITPNARFTRFDCEEARNHIRRLAKLLRDIEQMSNDLRS
jgi:hypothetical protein